MAGEQAPERHRLALAGPLSCPQRHAGRRLRPGKGREVRGVLGSAQRVSVQAQEMRPLYPDGLGPAQGLPS